MKVSEGCNNRCAYCAIPGIRGRMQSRPLEDLVREAGELAKQGVKEIILVAQDTTGYGVDIYKERKLAELIRLLLPTPGIERIRFLYAYANGMTDELLHLMAAQPKVLPYIDLPIQHASDAVLHRMRRTDTQAFLRKTFARIRTVLPQAVLRTTVMVGFPGETEEEFTELYEFVKEIGFDHLGAFIFSPEEGTEAAKMPDQVPLAVAEDRYERIMTLQRAIAAEKNHILIDNDHLYPVLIESVSDDGIFYIGRTDFQAPEIDSLTYVVSERELQIGEICPVTLVEYSDYDLIGVCKDEFT
jgi:ribosomal protein S12 methylthiotransferase